MMFSLMHETLPSNDYKETILWRVKNYLKPLDKASVLQAMNYFLKNSK